MDIDARHKIWRPDTVFQIPYWDSFGSNHAGLNMDSEFKIKSDVHILIIRML